MIDRLALALLEGWEREDCFYFVPIGHNEEGEEIREFCEEFQVHCCRLCEYCVLVMEEFAQQLND